MNATQTPTSDAAEAVDSRLMAGIRSRDGHVLCIIDENAHAMARSLRNTYTTLFFTTMREGGRVEFC